MIKMTSCSESGGETWKRVKRALGPIKPEVISNHGRHLQRQPDLLAALASRLWYFGWTDRYQRMTWLFPKFATDLGENARTHKYLCRGASPQAVTESLCCPVLLLLQGRSVKV